MKFFSNTDDTFLQADLINRVDEPQYHDLQYISGCFTIGACFFLTDRADFHGIQTNDMWMCVFYEEKD